MIFRRKYFIWSILLFITEVLIALFVHDKFIRPYFGDFLVVIFLYCLFRTLLRFKVIETAIVVLLIAYLVEWTQYLHLISIIGWQDSRLARAIMGSSFSWEDMLAYTLGILTVILIEKHFATLKI